MRTTAATVLLLAVSCLTLCGGCGRGNPRRPVSGSVQFHNQPVQQGRITFLTTSGLPGPACGALIEAGRYDIPAAQGLPPGTYRVAISCPGPPAPPTPAEVAAGASARAQELIPPKYNDETTLTAEVKDSGRNQLDFAIP